jgi:DNA polymerase-3 subunit delta'
MLTGLFDDDIPDEDGETFDRDDIPSSAPATLTALSPRENPHCWYHQDVEKILLDFIASGSIPHALIFSGPKGIGKATMAYRLTRYLLKNGLSSASPTQDSLFGDSVPAAPSLDVAPDDPVFHRVASGGHTDLLTIEKPDDKDDINVETARKIAPFLRLTASGGGYKIVIVDDADTLNRNGQNALLKILEEPPAQTVIILVTHRLGGLLPTIRSRCRVIPFQTLPVSDISDFVKKYHPDISAYDMDTLCHLADGSPGSALQIFEGGGMEILSSVVDLLASWPDWDWVRVHGTAETYGRGREDEYVRFCENFKWTMSYLTRAKAVQAWDQLPRVLQKEPLKNLWGHYSLEEWVIICDNVTAHFDQVKYGSLDRRHGILGVFPLLRKS